MKLTEGQIKVLLKAVKNRDDAKNNYLQISQAVNELITLVSGKDQFDSWEINGDELIIHEKKEEPKKD